VTERPRSTWFDRLVRWLPAGLIAVAVLIRLPTLTLPLLERHAFRQTQTAYTARIFHTDGIDLLHPQLPVFGPPWQVPFEFPLYQAGAALFMDLGVDETVALRGLSLALFAVSAGLLWLLLAPRIGRLGAGVALVVFLFTPLGMVWSRTSMIEYLAVAASLGFAVSGLTWRDRGGWRWWLLAAALGSIAMTVKITSAVFWIAPFALLGFARDRDTSGERGSWRNEQAWVLVAVPIVLGLLWTRHADAIKAASEATAWLTSSGLFEWNFGTLEQRLEPEAWAKALRPSLELTAMGLLPFAAVLTAWFAVRHGQWRFWAWVGIAYAAPLAVFFNLYVVHDYYSAAIAPAAAAIVGCGVAALARVVRPGGGWKAVAASALLTLGAVTFVGNVATHWSYAAPIFGDPPISTAQLDLGAQIAAETRPDQLVAIIAHDWDPALLFYAGRRGFMVRGSTFAPGQLERFLAEDYAVYRCPWYGDDAWTCTRITTAPE
jgi:4-amino-4-deoxy-L-arabinose transferase-like glycosyltransferase